MNKGKRKTLLMHTLQYVLCLACAFDHLSLHHKSLCWLHSLLAHPKVWILHAPATRKSWCLLDQKFSFALLCSLNLADAPCNRGASNKEELSRLLHDKVMIRRLKKDVLKQLPAKNRRDIPICPDTTLMKVTSCKQVHFQSAREGSISLWKQDSAHELHFNLGRTELRTCEPA